MSAPRFRHEDVSAVRPDERVRTITTPTGHQVRVAFPPGPRRRGAGRLVSVLHPNQHTHCGDVKVRFVSPTSDEGARLLANPGLRRRAGLRFLVRGGRARGNPPAAPVLIYPRVEEIRAIKPDGQPYFHRFEVGAKTPPFTGAAKDYGLPDGTALDTPGGRFTVANGSFLVTTRLAPEASA